MPPTQIPTASVFAENRQFKAYPTEQQVVVLLNMQRAYQLWWNQILDWTVADFEQKALKTGMAGLAVYSKKISVHRNALKKADPSHPMLVLSIGSLSMILKKQLLSWDQVFNTIAQNKKNGSALPIGQPRFKSHHQCRSESIPFVFDKRFASTAVHLTGRKSDAWISVPMLASSHTGKRLTFARSDTLNGDIGSFTIHRKASGWMICLNVTGIQTFAKPWSNQMKSFPDPTADPVTFGENGIGLDAGMRTRLMSSNPEIAPLSKIPYSLRDQKTLKILAKKKAHKLRYAKKAAGLQPNQPLQKGQRLTQSKRSRQIEQRIEKIHEHVRNSNKDALHKFTTDIIKNHSFIAVETLALKPMASSKTKSFRRSFHHAAMGACIAQLEYKAKRYDRPFIKVDRFFASSKLCSTIGCSYKNTKLKLSHTVWTCPHCNTTHQRDRNAAENIRREGLRLIHKNHVEGLLRIPSTQTVGLAAVRDIGCGALPHNTASHPILDCSRMETAMRSDVKKTLSL